MIEESHPHLIAGCNGAGKTTFAKEFLPKEVKCLRFLNADEIARGFRHSILRRARSAPLADKWAVWDNQTSPPTLMAESETCSIAELGNILSAS